jgi:predicted transport protein
VKTSQDYENEFLATIVEATGKDLPAWLVIVKGAGITKTPDITRWLKAEYGLNHAQARMLAGIYKNDGKPVYASDHLLIDALFAGKEDKRPLYEALETRVRALFPDVQVVPTKSYMSFRDEREFAVASITSKEIRVGMDLADDFATGDAATRGVVKPAKSLGAMPRISHMVELRSASEIDAALEGYLKMAHARVAKG